MLFYILVLDFILVIIASTITSFIDSFLFELESDPIEELFSNKGAFSILIIAAVVIPFIEELLFRFFLKYERNLLFHFFDFLTKNKAKTFRSIGFLKSGNFFIAFSSEANTN